MFLITVFTVYFDSDQKFLKTTLTSINYNLVYKRSDSRTFIHIFNYICGEINCIYTVSWLYIEFEA